MSEIYYRRAPWWTPRSREIEIEILNSTKNSLEIRVIGETHTFFNSLVYELLRDPDVTFASYKIEHPLFDRILLVVKTKENSPFEAIRKAVNRLRKRFSSLRKKLLKAIEEGPLPPPFMERKEWKRISGNKKSE
ncbi:MAG: DNA-directed RNA polymerase subunit L [Candidatus Njordarchaeia archaeon]|nr:DNA-directed RNA polymerase subunit L [Candidatus Korarchaeota archaeon]